jgi:hypothetical protein
MAGTSNGAVAAPPTASGADPATLVQVADLLKLYVQSQGQATRKEIREHATKVLNVSQDVYGKAWAILHDQAKITTEVTRESGDRAYQIKRHFWEVPLPELVAQIEEAKGPKKKYEKFANWHVVTGTMTLLNEALSGRPVADSQSLRRFVRVGKDGSHVILMDVYFKEMFISAAVKPGMPPIGNGRYQVLFDPVLVPVSDLTRVLCPVPPQREGGSGQGIIEAEALPAGYAITFTATVPGSHIDRARFLAVMECAGRWVGFSPAAAHQGWGRFTVALDPAPEVAPSTVDEDMADVGEAPE